MHYNDLLDNLVNPPEKDWRPTWWTPMKSKATLGYEIADFMEKYHTPPRGDRSKGLKLSEWQRWLLAHIFELNAFGLFRYREVYVHILS